MRWCAGVAFWAGILNGRSDLICVRVEPWSVLGASSPGWAFRELYHSGTDCAGLESAANSHLLEAYHWLANETATHDSAWPPARLNEAALAYAALV